MTYILCPEDAVDDGAVYTVLIPTTMIFTYL